LLDKKHNRCVQPATCPVGREPQVFKIPAEDRGYIFISQRQSLDELRAAIARIRVEGWEQVIFVEASNPSRIVAFCDPHDLLIKLVSLPVTEYRLSEW
jgi:hypothetical protein